VRQLVEMKLSPLDLLRMLAHLTDRRLNLRPGSVSCLMESLHGIRAGE
jgi:hypothetical protein